MTEKKKKPKQSQGKEKFDNTTGVMDVDPEFGDSMPSVTRLLYKKSFGETKSRKSNMPKTQITTVPTAPPEAMSKTGDESESGIDISESTVVTTIKPTPAVPTKTPVLKPAKRKPQPAQLIRWEVATLKNVTDPLAQGLHNLIQSGAATSALFLGIIPPPEGSPVPHFVSTATVEPGSRSRTWSGLTWDPVLTPVLWNTIVKTAFAELPPPGTSTNLASARNVTRSSFGLETDEWLTLIRVGTPKNCRGVLVVISPRSLADEVQKNLEYFQAPLISQAA